MSYTTINRKRSRTPDMETVPVMTPALFKRQRVCGNVHANAKKQIQEVRKRYRDGTEPKVVLVKNEDANELLTSWVIETEEHNDEIFVRLEDTIVYKLVTTSSQKLREYVKNVIDRTQKNSRCAAYLFAGTGINGRRAKLQYFEGLLENVDMANNWELVYLIIENENSGSQKKYKGWECLFDLF
jgi:hypothetical protein